MNDTKRDDSAGPQQPSQPLLTPIPPHDLPSPTHHAPRSPSYGHHATNPSVPQQNSKQQPSSSQNRSHSQHRSNNNNNNSSNNNHFNSNNNNNNKDRKQSRDMFKSDAKFKNTDELSSLIIEDIADPDTYKDFEAEVRSVGTTTKFYINKRSRTCVVTFLEQEHAIQAMTRFKKIYWPNDAKGNRMRVKLLQNLDVSSTITKIQVAQNITRPEQEKFTQESRLFKSRQTEQEKRSSKYDRNRNSQERGSSRDRHSNRQRDRSYEKDRSRGNGGDYEREKKRDDNLRERSPSFDNSEHKQYKTSHKPSIYYTVQSKDVINQRKALIMKYYI